MPASPTATHEHIKDVNTRYHDAAADEYDAKWGIDFGDIGQEQVRLKLVKALGKLDGAGEKWSGMGDCKSAYPTASAAFLRGITKCYVARREAAGETAPDNTQILADCTDDVTVNMPSDTSAGQEALAARCDRMLRCEKVALPECKAAIDKLEAATRVLISTRFNGAALHEVAGCLASASCAANEDEPREACYKPVAEKLLWFP